MAKMDCWDCHSHLSFLSLSEAGEVLDRAPAGQAWALGGYQPSEWEAQVALKNEYPNRVVTCFGLHPWYIKSDEFNLSRDLEDLKIWSDQADLIGEVGLDFFGDDQLLKKEMQLDLFEKQLEIAQGKPIVFHIVQAHGKALGILKDHAVKGFVHSFSGSQEVAQQYVDMGILLSFGPSVLSEQFKKAREALLSLPLEAILIESDSPSHAVDMSDPIDNLNKVYNEVARMRGLSVEELKAQVNKNFSKLLA